MAALSGPQRLSIRDRLMREITADWPPCAGTKADLEALIADLDDYFDANASNINSAIRVGVRTLFTAAQKAKAGAYVLLTRWTG